MLSNFFSRKQTVPNSLIPEDATNIGNRNYDTHNNTYVTYYDFNGKRHRLTEWKNEDKWERVSIENGSRHGIAEIYENNEMKYVEYRNGKMMLETQEPQASLQITNLITTPSINIASTSQITTQNSNQAMIDELKSILTNRNQNSPSPSSSPSPSR